MALPSIITNRVLQRQPLNIHYLRRHLTTPKEDTATTTRKFSFFSRSKSSNQNANGCTTPDCSVITPEIPTPDGFYDDAGYAFSAVTRSSNPLYNLSIGSTATGSGKGKVASLSYDEFEESSSRTQEEGGESVLDFRITSMDGAGGGCGDKKTRPGYLWFPSLSPRPDLSLPKPGHVVSGPMEGEEGEEEGSPPSSSESDNNCKSQQATGHSLLTAGE